MMQRGFRRWGVAGAVVVALTATVLQLVVGTQSTGDAPELLFFFGRLHPLLVHLPIGMLILVGALELCVLVGVAKVAISRTLDLIQPLTLLSCLGAFVVGQWLGLEGGFSAGRLGEHRNLAFVTVLLSSVQCATWFLVGEGRMERRKRAMYRVVLSANLVALSAAAHVGGTLSRGEGYLARYAPGWAQPLLGGTEPKAASSPEISEPPVGADALVFAHAVQPMLLKYCAECHGAKQAKGGLRIDSIEALVAGGDSGPSVRAGAPDLSPLVTRSELPHDNEDAMPPEGEERPSAAQLALLRFWVAQGMSEELRLRDTLLPLKARSAVEHALAREAVPVEASGKSEGALETPADEQEQREPEAQGQAAATEALADTSPSAPNDAGSAFELIQEKCVDCHGPTKQKGRLRVDSLKALFEGGRSGAGIVRGAHRGGTVAAAIVLPLSNKDHMPPKNKPQFSAAEQRRVISWLAAQAGSASAATTTAGTPTEPEVVEEFGAGLELDTKGEGAFAPVSLLCAQPEAAPPGQALLFDELVLPILADKCASCHERELSSGGLDVTTCETVLTGGDAGQSVIPGQVAESLLVQRLLLEKNHDEHMPPADYPQLLPEEQELIEQWVERGARRDLLVLTAGNERAAEAKQAQAQAERPAEISPQGAKGGGFCSLGRGRDQSGLLLFLALLYLARWKRKRTALPRSKPAVG